MSGSAVPPGWYVDPAGVMRWWDGRQWTPYTAPPPRTPYVPMPPAPARPVPAPPREPKPIEPALIEPGQLDRGLAGRVRPWQVVLVGLAALAVIVIVAWLLVTLASDASLG